MLPVIPSEVILTSLMGNTASVALVEHGAVFWIRLGQVVKFSTGGAIRELSFTLPEEKS